MGRRTDHYPIKASADLRRRMDGCEQVSPSAARRALLEGRLVFGLCPDMKWRQVELITVHKPDLITTVYRVVFADPPNYVRDFTRDGILLAETVLKPDTLPTRTTDLTGD